jgi:cell division protein FtsQ
MPDRPSDAAGRPKRSTRPARSPKADGVDAAEVSMDTAKADKARKPATSSKAGNADSARKASRTDRASRAAAKSARREASADSGTGPVSRVLVDRYLARMRSRNRWLRLSVTLTVLTGVLAVATYVVVWQTSVFGVRTVRVRGNQVLTAAQIEQVAAVRRGAAVESLNTAAVAHRVESLPRVATAVVRTEFPHTVVITVTERQPAALLPDGAGFDVLDDTGVTLATTTSKPAGLPVIQISADQVTDPNDRQDIVRGVLAALSALPRGIPVRQASATDPYAITLDLASGATVDWGGGDQPQAKAQALVALLRQPARHYDVSVPSAPALTPN